MDDVSLRLYEKALAGDCKYTLQVETLAMYREAVFRALTDVLPAEYLPDTLRAIQRATLPFYAKASNG